MKAIEEECWGSL